MPKFRESEAHERSEVGLVTGLAWTEVGGSILTTEVQVLDGKGKLTVTGQLGDVMQESAQAALAYIRSRAHQLGRLMLVLSQHRHPPARARRRDSQGRPVGRHYHGHGRRQRAGEDPGAPRHRHDRRGLALRGKVLPIGGLKRKAAGGAAAGIFEATRRNNEGPVELPDNIKNSMKLHFVDLMDEVLAMALESLLPTGVPKEAEVLASVPTLAEGANGWCGAPVRRIRGHSVTSTAACPIQVADRGGISGACSTMAARSQQDENLSSQRRSRRRKRFRDRWKVRD